MLHAPQIHRAPMAIMAGLSLFESLEVTPVSGVSYYDEFISSRHETDLVAACAGGAWNQDYKRRVKMFGRDYRRGAHCEPMPSAYLALAKMLVDEGVFKSLPQGAHVNEYLPGQGIGAHRDIDSDQIDKVAIVSLGSGAVMNFTRLGRADVPLYLYPRSLLTFEGEALTKWMHAIPARKSDALGGLILPRSRRLSVVFRGR